MTRSPVGRVSFAGPFQCEVCGKEHPRGCRGHETGSARTVPCLAYPRRGQTHCGAHGGKSGQALRGAERRQAQAEIEATVRSLAEPVDVGDYGEVFLDLIRSSAGAVRALAVLVEQLGLDVAGPTFHANARPTGEAKPHVYVQMWGAERDRLAGFVATALKAGVDERKVRVAERQAQPLAEAIIRVLAHPDLALSGEQQAVARRLVAAEFRALTGGPDGGSPTRPERTIPASASQRPVRASDPRPSTTTPEEGA